MPDRSGDPLTEEVRLAMAWNGGVSLAVWMGGAAVEFDCARRAHVGVDDAGTGDEHLPRSLYTTIVQAFDRRLVVDILAGASAGGINGALMASAIRHNRRLHPDFVREQWLAFGDFASLLQPSSARKPSSILQGKLFYEGLLGVFEHLQSPEGDARVLLPDSQAGTVDASRPVLDVQVTTVEGEVHTFVDEWGDELVALEYRTPVRFREPADFESPEALARAARGSASFPVAFEPQEISGQAAALAGITGQRRWAMDGGLLENAPIRQALDLIPLRPASGPVKRYVCYVNAAPQTVPPVEPDEKAPDLRAVLGYVLNLPRDGRAIDQLTAIQAAIRDAEAAGDTQQALLDMTAEALAPTAVSLLSAYQRRRSALSLDELLGNPAQGTVGVILERLGSAGRQLPWIPDGPDVCGDAGDWQWGIRPAQRILFLELDILRQSVERLVAGGAVAEAHLAPVCDARLCISGQIELLEGVHTAFTASSPAGENLPGAVATVTADLARGDLSPADVLTRLDALDALMGEYRNDIQPALVEATTCFYEALRQVDPTRAGELFGLQAEELVPGALATTPAALARFVDRALRVEVVRRALADDRAIDSAQPLHFAQLTPRVACRLFASSPLSQPGPDDGEKKLTGIRLGHFAGFYRRSWRANDFLWGRLDAATRIVDLLVDAQRSALLVHLGRPSPAVALAEMLVPEGTDASARDRRWLVTQTLSEAGTATAGDLRARTQAAIEADLAAGDGGLLTRVLCARAVQYEIFAQELKVIVAETEADVQLGSAVRPLGLAIGEDGSLQGAIEQLQDPDPGKTLPQRLGRDSPDEATSTLAMRTISHAALVSLAALPGLSMPMARAALPARVPFLAVSGITARGLLEQFAVVAAFVASACYLTARLVSAAHAPSHPKAELRSIGSPSVWVLWIAVLVVAACAFLPGWRARGTAAQPLRSGVQWGLAALLLAVGGIVPIVGSLFTLGVPETIVGANGFTPNGWILGCVLLAAGLLSLALRQFGKIGKPIMEFHDRTLRRSHATAALVVLVSAMLIVESSRHLWRGFGLTPWWDAPSVVLAVLSVVVAASYVFGQRPARALATRRAQSNR